jgi:glycosyltransferase involved in cell wall biosynthesis
LYRPAWSGLRVVPTSPTAYNQTLAFASEKKRMTLTPLPPTPVVSIVTPTYNMGRFLGETMDSVLSQDYPYIEYIVMDGGSSDETVEILRDYEQRYPGRFTWISEKDAGQSDAVNKGFLRTKGQIFTFLNSDDTYLPGAVRAAVEAFVAHPEVAVVYGDAWYTDEQNAVIKKYTVSPYSHAELGRSCCICQPAALVRADVFREAGMLDVNLHLTLDYDLWLKISAGYPMFKIDRPMANSRMWADNKTLSRRRVTFQEVVKILQRNRGYVPLNWVYGYAAFLLDGKDGFYQVSQPSLRGFALATMMGLWFNRRRPWQFITEILLNTRLAGYVYWDPDRPRVG